MSWLEGILSMQDRYIGNLAAVILVSMLIAANRSRIKSRQKEYRALLFLLVSIGLYGFAEMASCAFDGMPGIGFTVLLYLLNSALYAVNMMLGYGWVRFIAIHLGYPISKRTDLILRGIMYFGLLLLAVNPFTDLVFAIRGNSYAARGPLYLVYIIIAGIYLFYTIYVYHVCRRNGGVLKYFPVWMYVVPVLLGMLLETLLGSSLISICNAIGISAVLTSLQQEEVFRDRLTGLYNRAYLEELKAKLERTQNPYVSGIMMDLNGFKGINDSYGHAEGDQALITASGLIRSGAGSYGDVIRYAGDEYIIILNTLDNTLLQACVVQVQDAFTEYNRTSGKPYQLSVSLGYANFNADTQTVNEFLNMIDKNMYENKRAYYSQQANNRRRR